MCDCFNLWNCIDLSEPLVDMFIFCKLYLIEHKIGHFEEELEISYGQIHSCNVFATFFA